MVSPVAKQHRRPPAGQAGMFPRRSPARTSPAGLKRPRQQMRSEVKLPRDAAAPRIARSALSTSFGAALRPDELDDALVVSELVSNALEHGVGQIHLAADL